MGVRVHHFHITSRFIYVARVAKNLTFREFLISSLLRPCPHFVIHFMEWINMIDLKTFSGAAFITLLVRKPLGTSRGFPLTLVFSFGLLSREWHTLIILADGHEENP